MFSTDFIFRQQENLVDNQKCQAGFRPLCNKILLLKRNTNNGLKPFMKEKFNLTFSQATMLLQKIFNLIVKVIRQLQK